MFKKITSLKIYKKRNLIGVSLKFMSNLMGEKNQTVVVDRDKLQSVKRQCAAMRNNFVHKTLKEARGAKHPVG